VLQLRVGSADDELAIDFAVRRRREKRQGENQNQCDENAMLHAVSIARAHRVNSTITTAFRVACG